MTRQLFACWLNVLTERLKQGAVGCRLVDAVPGSLFMLRARTVFGGNSQNGPISRFLYYEEGLGQSRKLHRLTAVLALDYSYVPCPFGDRQGIEKHRGLQAAAAARTKSKLYYYREYLHAGPVRQLPPNLSGACWRRCGFSHRGCAACAGSACTER